MNEISTGMYTIPLEFEFMGEKRTIYPMAFETGRGGLFLVDVGLSDHVKILESQLAEAGFRFDDIEVIIITHQDSDHAGGLSEIKKRSGAIVAAHADDTPYIQGDKPLIKGDERYSPESVDIELVDDVRFQTAAGKARVVATPGHTPGHISLYFPDENFLLAADALTAEDEFGGPNEDFTPDINTAIDSVGRLAEYNVERTLCYHGGLIEHESERIKNIHSSLT